MSSIIGITNLAKDHLKTAIYQADVTILEYLVFENCFYVKK